MPNLSMLLHKLNERTRVVIAELKVIITGKYNKSQPEKWTSISASYSIDKMKRFSKWNRLVSQPRIITSVVLSRSKQMFSDFI